MGAADIATVFEAVIAAAALIDSIVSIIKARKAEKVQDRVAELDAVIKEIELERLQREQTSKVEARIVPLGKGNRLLRICNVGQGIAKCVDYDVKTEKYKGLVLRQHAPFPELKQHDSFDETVIVYPNGPSNLEIEVFWKDEFGNDCSDTFHLAL